MKLVRFAPARKQVLEWKHVLMVLSLALGFTLGSGKRAYATLPPCMTVPDDVDDAPDPPMQEWFGVPADPASGYSPRSGATTGSGTDASGTGLIDVGVVPSHIFVRFKPGTTEDQKCDLYTRWDFVWAEELDPMFGDDPNTTLGAYGLNLSVQNAVVQMLQEPIVEWAEPNFLGGFDAVLPPDDKCYTSQDIGGTCLGCPTGDATCQWYLPAVKALEGWQYQTGSSAYDMLVIDTGVEFSHPEFGLNQLHEYGISATARKKRKKWCPWCVVHWVPDVRVGLTEDGYGNWDCTRVFNPGCLNWDVPWKDHGTEVMGMAAARTNNTTGIAGSVWGVKLVPARAAKWTCHYPGVPSAYEGNCPEIGSIIMIMQKFVNDSHFQADGAYRRVFNLSGTVPKPKNWWERFTWSYTGVSSLFRTLHGQLQTYYANGILPVVSAGNDNTNWQTWPAAFTDSVLSVGGLGTPDAQHNMCRWVATTGGSDYGDWVEVSAPAADITTTATQGSGLYRAYLEGTSFAAPLVTGLSHLMCSAFGTRPQDCTPDWRKAKIKSTSRTYPGPLVCSGNPLGLGSINYEDALKP